MSRDLADCAVVITGATSGIGRAAVYGFARRGSRLGLAARSAEALDELARECAGLGAEAVAVPTDVRDEEAVERLARRVEDRFGRLDVWVNCAGVMAYGRFDQVPSETFRAVIDTNLMGQVHGARAALRRFRTRGTGVLINMASVWGRVTAPEVSAYVTSKFAVRAFSEVLRQELRDLEGVDVATMLPQAVDTPIFDHAANHSGHNVRPIAPILDAADVAHGIVLCAQSPKREVTYSHTGRLIEISHSLAPGTYNRVLPPSFEAGNYGEESAAPTDGIVMTASGGGAVRGGWKDQRAGELRRALRDSLRAALRTLRPRR